MQSMPPEFPPHIALRTALAEGALDALDRGDGATHDQLVAQAARRLREQGCTRIALAQFSLARARQACEEATGLPVYTTVHAAVDQLRRRLG
ncbi:MAG: hypothetical protein GAK30_02124 [Paracidovorax wautersii]|uniref:Uncharacterized protein n=1 Tax=Paracidovorax wautersii TaxID=1177982 RepID=A0A7V8FNN8_9BURK|nr:MAG: hypothetical protein GAK30_02124 [Paracidovorax wautersii]